MSDEQRSIDELIAASSIGAGLRDIEERGIDAHVADLEKEMVPLSDLQREAGWVNELNGVVAFCAGVFDRIMKCKSLEEAKTCAEMGATALEERHAGLWQPGPHDDPADWKAAP